MALVLVTGTTLVAAQQSQSPQSPQSTQLPPPFATPSATNRSRVVEKPSDVQLKLPKGFSAQVWAEGFDRPRFMLEGSRGEILIADSGGVVYGVGPGADPSTRKKLVEGLDRPYGLALWKDYLYVREPMSVKRYAYDPAALTAGKGEEVISLSGLGGGHWTRSLLFDRAGQKLYVGVGSGSNIGTGEDPRRAAINRYNPDGSGHETYASGTRNPIGLHWYPGTDVLWAAVQERDGLGDDLPPDYFTHVRPEGFYGWPYAYFGPNEEPRLKGQQPDLVKRTIAPDLSLGAHVAVLDFTFYTGTQFPAEYHGGAFLALHGSWNRSRRVGYSMVFVPFKDGKPTGTPQEFLTGWMLAPDSADVWGRPVAVLQLSDGSLLVSDDGGKRVWRITYSA